MSKIIVGQPVSEAELAELLSLSRAGVKRLLDAYSVRPAFYVGRARIACYWPGQVELLYSIVHGKKGVATVA